MRPFRKNRPVHVRRRDLLDYRDFRFLLGGQFISQVSDAGVSVILAQFVLFESKSGSTATRLLESVVTALFPLLLAGPISGLVADNVSRQTILRFGQLARALLVMSLLVFCYFDIRIGVYLSFAGALCLTRVLYTTRISTIRHLVRRHELVAADSLLLIASNIAGAIGSALGVLLLSAIGVFGLCFLAVGHLLSVAIYACISTPLGGGSDHERASWTTTCKNLFSPKNRYAIATTGAFRFLFGIAIASAAIQTDTGNARSYVILFAASGVGTFIGNLSAEWTNEHLPRRSLAVSCFVLAALFSGLYLVTQNIQMLSACILATSFVFQNLRVCSDATVQKNAASGAGGRVFAGYDVVSNLSFLLGLIAGLLAMTSMSYHLIVSLLIFGFSTSALAFSMMRRDENQALSNDNSKVSKRQITQADFDSDTVDNWRPRQESEPKGCYRLRS